MFDKNLSLEAVESIFLLRKKKIVIYGQFAIICLYSYRQIDHLKINQNNTRLDKYNSERYKLKEVRIKKTKKKKSKQPLPQQQSIQIHG